MQMKSNKKETCLLVMKIEQFLVSSPQKIEATIYIENLAHMQDGVHMMNETKC